MALKINIHKLKAENIAITFLNNQNYLLMECMHLWAMHNSLELGLRLKTSIHMNFLTVLVI